jgi:hypothetical protein
MERTSSLVLIDMIMGFRTTQLIHVAAKLGIADLLNDGPRHSAELAQATGADPHALYRLLRALASMGIFAELNDGRFDLTPLAQLLRQDAPGSVRGLALLYGEPWIWQAYGALLHTVQTGTTAFESVHGMNIFSYLAQHPDAAQVFQQAMTAFSGQELAAILAAYDFTHVRHAVDVGGGEGALLATLLEHYPTMQGTLFDLPPTIERVRKQRAGQAGVWARCTFAAGDFFQAVSPGGDLYLLKRVIHDWTDAQSIAILKQCRIAMADEGKLLILERVIAPGNDPSEAKLFDINMLVSAGGQERNSEEFGALLEAAGFRLTQVIATASPLSIVEGVPV